MAVPFLDNLDLPPSKPLAVEDGGTGANNAAGARSNLGVQGYDVAFRVVGKPAAGAVVAEFIAPRAFTIASALSGTQIKAGTAAAASAAFSLRKNGTEFGTATFAAAGTVPTLAAASQTSFAAGDVLRVVAPATADATLADIVFTVVGVLA